ncbi:MAG: hypothetical protein GW778_03435 [Alphaproteobacteria bacterium]|nr:hypothetical protein [Alphaproteobacteria bacterium]
MYEGNAEFDPKKAAQTLENSLKSMEKNGVISEVEIDRARNVHSGMRFYISDALKKQIVVHQKFAKSGASLIVNVSFDKTYISESLKDDLRALRNSFLGSANLLGATFNGLRKSPPMNIFGVTLSASSQKEMDMLLFCVGMLSARATKDLKTNMAPEDVAPRCDGIGG